MGTINATAPQDAPSFGRGAKQMPRIWKHRASNARTGYKQHPAPHTLRLAWRGDDLGQRSFWTWLSRHRQAPTSRVALCAWSLIGCAEKFE
ncbi:hypothetical protein N7453_007287 [Penicillium expansum]|nr:hypothetical protein N7453_007287 [Penicillium expansum]